MLTLSRPNIVVIFSDDHARAAISAYGSKLIQTPGIDRLAKQGVLFERHYTSNPICAPSRATLLTGKFSHRNGHKDNISTFDGSQMTLQKALQAAGYETAALGKWHLKSNPTGFDHWEIVPGQGDYQNPRFLTEAGEHTEQGYVTDLITKKALDWVRKPRTKPFFLFVGHKAPHRNWIPRMSDLSLYQDAAYPEPPTLRTDYATLCSAAKTVNMRIDRDMRPKEDLLVNYAPPRLSEPEQEEWRKLMAPQDDSYRAALEGSKDILGTNYRRYLQSYLRCVKAVDDSVSTLLDALDLKNTIVVYASDQGFFLGENGWYDKRWFYEPSAGTPLIVHVPGVTPHRVAEVTSNVDVAPTLLQYAGVPIPSEMQGRSLLSFGKGVGPKPPAYGHFYESDDPDHKAPQYVAIATGRHKIIFYYQLQEWEIFDLQTDSRETRNLWPGGLARATRSELIRKLIARQREVQEEPEYIRLTEEAARRALLL